MIVPSMGDLTSRVGHAMASAYRAESAWVDGVRAALLELLDFLDARSQLARALLVGPLAEDPRTIACRRSSLAKLAHAVELDSPPASPGSPLAPFGAEAIVGAVASVIQARLAAESEPRLCELCGPLMGLIVLPYLGARPAREELLRPLSRRAVAVESEACQ